MVYQGSKRKIIKDISKFIFAKIDEFKQTTENIIYYEPFVGGANSIEYISKHYKGTNIKFVGNDINKYLIALLIHIQEHKLPEFNFHYENKKYLHELNKYLNLIVLGVNPNELGIPDWFIGCCMLAHTFRGLWNSGIALTKNDKDSRLNHQIKKLNNMDLSNIKFTNNDAYRSLKDLLVYSNLSLKYKFVIYCDPPYLSTDQSVYTRNKTIPKFTYNKDFENLIKNSNKDNVCWFFSENQKPNLDLDLKLIWEKQVQNNSNPLSQNKTRKEQLYYYGNN